MPAQPTELQARLIDIFGNPLTADPTKLYGNLTVNPDGTIGVGTGIVMPDGYTHAFTPMGRNRAINGAAQVAQRPAVTTTTGVPLYGGPDRFWCASVGTGTFTQSQGIMSVGGRNLTCVQQQVVTAQASFGTTNYFSGVVQKFEGFNVYDLLGQPVTASFLFQSNISGTFSCALQDSTQANSCVKTFSVVAGTPTRISVTFPALPTSLVVPNSAALGLFLWIGMVNQATYQTSTLNSWISGNYISANTSTNWGATTGNWIQVTELQLEQGIYATPFERLQIPTQLSNCMRYYERLVGGNYGVGAMNSATNAYVVVNWQQFKRVAPSVSGSSAGTFYLYSGNGNATVTAISWPTVTARQALAQVAVTSIGAAAGYGAILEDQSGTSYIEFSSEL